MINKSDTPINFYKVKSHIGVTGNAYADAVAKYAALHSYGHGEAFPPPSSDGNPFSHICPAGIYIYIYVLSALYWLAEDLL